jgi:phosphoserine phosphatase RsbU/P
VRLGASAVGASLAGMTLALLVLLDVLTRDQGVTLAPLFALSPLIACAVLPVAPTAGFAAASLLGAVASGFWNENFDSGQQIVRIVDVTLVSAAAVVVAAVRVRRERRLQRVTHLAQVAQRAVLPVLPAHARRVAIAVRYLSAADDAEIGGDLYDCYHSRSHTRFLIGDVRGKGIGAVEQAARVIRAFRQAAAIEPSLDAVSEDMNSYLIPFFDEEEFVTALLVDTTVPLLLTLVRAGHPPPMLVRSDGSSELLELEGALPLGLDDHYSPQQVPWTPGDRLLLYTDGLSEARNHAGEFIDLARLARRLVGQPLEDALDDLLDAVRNHVVGGELTDDLAVMLLEHTTSQQDYRPQDTEHDWRTSLAR